MTIYSAKNDGNSAICSLFLHDKISDLLGLLPNI